MDVHSEMLALTSPVIDARSQAPVASGPTVAQVFRNHASGVWRALCFLGVPEQDLPDASQDVFMVVLRKLGEFRGECRLETWLYGICLRVAEGRRRGLRGKLEQISSEPPEVAVGPQQESDAELARARRLLCEALDQLDEDQRQVFVLAEIEQMPIRDVAATVGCPLFTAYSRRRLARKRISSFVASHATEMQAAMEGNAELEVGQ